VKCHIGIEKRLKRKEEGDDDDDDEKKQINKCISSKNVKFGGNHVINILCIFSYKMNEKVILFVAKSCDKTKQNNTGN